MRVRVETPQEIAIRPVEARSQADPSAENLEDDAPPHREIRMRRSVPPWASVLACVLTVGAALLWLVGDVLAAEDNLSRRMRKAVGLHEEWLESEGKEGRRLDLLELWEPHKLWIETAGESGERGDLSELDLSEVDLQRANLSEAILRGANLWDANLSGAHLVRADLRKANLSEVDLSDAKLWDADLSGADLPKANLRNAALMEANLSGARLWEANLTGADLGGANLRRTYLATADLKGANLYGAALTETNLSHADLRKANLSWADLSGADLRGADLRGANLTKANLILTNLTDADLSETNLTYTDLSAANLTNADLRDAHLVHTNLSVATVVHTDLAAKAFRGIDLRAATFEPATVPPPQAISDVRGLQTASVTAKHPTGLVLFRASLASAGLRALEREATFLIERAKAQDASTLERLMKTVLFDWTSAYGLHPGRPLLILGTLIGVFSIVYWLPILGLGRARIVRVWPSDRLISSPDASFALADSARVEPLTYGPIRGLALALYFSLLSAFHIGWRELNVGTWISRVQPREYALRASGWVRTVSGLQSVMSVYLLALSTLTYFGRPFE